MSANGETVVPEARGKAMAMQTWLAQAGNLRGRTVNGKKRRETYKSGPMAGLTLEQAKVKFESIWSGASPEWKNTYAAKARNSLSPSERKEYDAEVKSQNARKDARAGITGVNPTPPPTRAAAPSPPAQKPSTTGTTSQFKDLSTPPTVPAGGTAMSVGDGSTAENGFTPLTRPPGAPPAPGEAQVPGVSPTPQYNPMQVAPVAPKEAPVDAAAVAIDAKNRSEMATAIRYSQALPSAKQEDENRIINARKSTQPNGTQVPGSGNMPAPPTAATPSPVTAAPAQASPPVVQATAPPVDQTAAPQISGIQPTPTQVRPQPTRTALATAPDFTPGPNKELTGMSAGRPTYSSADSLYGKPKLVPGNSMGDIKKTMDRTPLAGDPLKPVMIGSYQSMDQRRADYQNRSNTPQSQQGAINALRSNGINNAATKDVAAVPGLSPTPPPNMQSRLDNPNSAFSKEAMARTEAAKEQGVKYAADQAKKPTMDDVNRRYTPGTAENKSAAMGVNPTTGGQLTKDDLAVKVRPATSADRGMKLGVPYSRGVTRK